MTDPLRDRFRSVTESRNDSSWEDVRRRARGRSLRRPVVLVAAAALLAVLATAPALGLHRHVVSFLESEPAPPEIRTRFEEIDIGSTAEFEGERQLVVTGRRHDGAAMIAGGSARGARLTVLGSFVPVSELGAVPVRPQGVNPLAGWDAKRDVVGDRAIVRFEADGGPRPDQVSYASVVGLVRSDVGRLVAELADGSRRELSVNRWRGFGYRAAPETAALALLAYDRDGSLLERTELSRPAPLCGGAYGPCDAELAQYLD